MLDDRLVELEAKHTDQRRLLVEIVKSKKPVPRAHLDFVILELEIKAFEWDRPGQHSNGDGVKNPWKESLKPAAELKKLLTAQPRDEARVNALKQEVTNIVKTELEALSIEFDLTGLERS